MRASCARSGRLLSHSQHFTVICSTWRASTGRNTQTRHSDFKDEFVPVGSKAVTSLGPAFSQVLSCWKEPTLNPGSSQQTPRVEESFENFSPFSGSASSLDENPGRQASNRVSPSGTNGGRYGEFPLRETRGLRGPVSTHFRPPSFHQTRFPHSIQWDPPLSPRHHGGDVEGSQLWSVRAFTGLHASPPPPPHPLRTQNPSTPLRLHPASRGRFYLGGVRSHMGHSHSHRDGLSELGVATGGAGAADKRGGEGGERIMRIGLTADICLTLGKGAAGYISGSAAIIADAVHSVTDIVLSGVSLWSVRAARIPSDATFPYGRGKFETVGALGVAVLLTATAGGIAWHALEVLQVALPEASSAIAQVLHTLGLGRSHGVGSHGHGHLHSHSHGGLDLEHVEVALAAAVVAIGVKESLYWATQAVGQRLNSSLLKANAWHHRSDAISSLVALIGVGGALVGLPLLDPLAALLVAGMIGRASTSIFVQSLKELVDVGLPESLLAPIRRTILEVPSVEGCLHLRGHKMGSGIHVDAHIAVGPTLSLRAAHAIGEEVRRQLSHSYPLVREINVHIDPADGGPTLKP